MDSHSISREQLCAIIDHTNLKPFAGKAEFEKLCAEAAAHRFAMVAINSSPVSLCKQLLKGSGVHVGAAVSFPTGQTTIEAKAFETEDAIANGADEIDYVINVGELKNGNLAYIRKEMEAIVSICHRNAKICKVIFETCYLTDDEIRAVAKIAREVRPDYIKTSTGYGPTGCDGGKCAFDEADGRRRCKSKGGGWHTRLDNLRGHGGRGRRAHRNKQQSGDSGTI